MQRNDRSSLVMFISSMLIFGSIGVIRRYIPFSSAFLAMARGLAGGLVILVFSRLKGRQNDPVAGQLPGKTMALLALSGAVMGFNWILLFEAYNYTTVGVATLCYYMEPTIVTLLSPLLFREKLGGKKLLCAAAAVIGMVLVSGVLEESGAGSPRGVLLGLGAAVLYSVVVILNKKTPGVGPYRKTTVQLLSAGVVMIPYLLLTEGTVTGGPYDTRTVILLTLMCLVHTGLAYVLYFGSMDGLRAQSIAIFSYIDPVSALVFSAVLLHEPMSAMGIIGAALIIGSAVMSELNGKKTAA